MAKIRPGGWAWIALPFVIGLVDWALIRSNNKTMSEVFGDSLAHPVKRFPVVLVWTVLTLHLFSELIPAKLRLILKRFDPISGIAHLLTPKQ